MINEKFSCLDTCSSLICLDKPIITSSDIVILEIIDFSVGVGVTLALTFIHLCSVTTKNSCSGMQGALESVPLVIGWERRQTAGLSQGAHHSHIPRGIFQFSSCACLWIVGGNRCTYWKSTETHEEHAQGGFHPVKAPGQDSNPSCKMVIHIYRSTTIYHYKCNVKGQIHKLPRSDGYKAQDNKTVKSIEINLS